MRLKRTQFPTQLIQRQWIQTKTFMQNSHINAGVGQCLQIRPTSLQRNHTYRIRHARQTCRQQCELSFCTRLVESWNDVSNADQWRDSNKVKDLPRLRDSLNDVQRIRFVARIELRAVVSAKFGERHASACRYKNVVSEDRIAITANIVETDQTDAVSDRAHQPESPNYELFLNASAANHAVRNRIFRWHPAVTWRRFETSTAITAACRWERRLGKGDLTADLGGCGNCGDCL